MSNTNQHVTELRAFELTLNQSERLEELASILAADSTVDDFLSYCEEYDDLITLLEADESLDH